MGGKILQEDSGGIIRVRVIPRGKVNEIVEILQDGRVKIRLTAPPVNGKANKSLLLFLSTLLEVPRSSIQIISGTKGRDKLIRVNELDQASIDLKIKSKGA